MFLNKLTIRNGKMYFTRSRNFQAIAVSGQLYRLKWNSWRKNLDRNYIKMKK